VTNLARTIILHSGESRVVAGLMRRHGLRLGVSRFVAGEDLAAAVSVARALNERGIRCTLNSLGEAVANPSDVELVTTEFSDMLDAISAGRLDADVSVKLSHVGLLAGEQIALANAARIADAAAERGNTVWIDMEDSTSLEATLRIYKALRERGNENVCVALQAYLHRTADDLSSLLLLSPRIRLVKGAYLEPRTISYPEKAAVDASFARLMETAMVEAGFTAIATHDDKLIDRAIAIADERSLPRERFEFQMMYGVRTRLQEELAERGYGVRVIVSFGSDWYRFFIRRLAERPANVGFVLRNLVRA
jgi:proline dehydrogenase